MVLAKHIKFMSYLDGLVSLDRTWLHVVEHVREPFFYFMKAVASLKSVILKLTDVTLVCCTNFLHFIGSW